VPETLVIERDGAIATIWINRPDVHNAFNETVIAELDEAAQALESDAGVRVVVLAGRGKSFSAGADLNWMQRLAAATEAENLLDARRFAAMLRRVALMGKPTVARVHGAALGGGVGLAAACDICVASEDAIFGMTEVRLGLIPAVISPYVVRAIGVRQSLRYVQTAERITAARAVELGLAHEAVAANALDERIGAYATALCAGGPASMAHAKRQVLALESQVLTDAVVDQTAHAIAAQRASPEGREGLAAYFAKRPPAWTPPA
jgi:methylglutaconyl-CoA hydratase